MRFYMRTKPSRDRGYTRRGSAAPAPPAAVGFVESFDGPAGELAAPWVRTSQTDTWVLALDGAGNCVNTGGSGTGGAFYGRDALTNAQRITVAQTTVQFADLFVLACFTRNAGGSAGVLDGLDVRLGAGGDVNFYEFTAGVFVNRGTVAAAGSVTSGVPFTVEYVPTRFDATYPATLNIYAGATLLASVGVKLHASTLMEFGSDAVTVATSVNYSIQSITVTAPAT